MGPNGEDEINSQNLMQSAERHEYTVGKAAGA
jgi:hypothetical protein